jgi:hypothetical protein
VRATRAYIASLGTTGILVLASLLALAVVGGIVGFDGWPGSRAAAGPERFVVDAGEERGPDRERSDRASRRRGAGGARPGDARRAAPTEERGERRRGGRRGERRDRPDRGPGRGGPPGTTPTDPPGGAPPPRSTLDGLADATQGATGFLGEAIGRVEPGLGETVTQTGEDAADTVRRSDDGQASGGSSQPPSLAGALADTAGDALATPGAALP